MAEGMNNLMGGLLTGFVGSKNKAREMALNEEYKKIAMENVKATAKLHEAQIKKADLEGNLLAWAMGGDPAGGVGLAGGQPTPTPSPAQPFAQFQPQVAPQAAAAQPLENTIAAAQMPIGGGGVNIPGNAANNISVRQNNPFNLKYVGQAEATGPGTRGFAIFPTPEAGVQAGIKQIQLDQSRGLTLSQFANKYAPPFENDTNNWIKNVGNMTGATPDTPIAQIPTFNLAQAVAKVESSATIGGPQPVQYAPPQGLGTPQQAIQPRGGLTREKFLEGYMKKNFGVEPDEVTVSSYGDHKLITDKKKGNPLFIIAGQGKTEMIDVTLPDGSVIKRPVVIPPSPLPGGIPVFNTAGQPTSGVGLGGPMQVKPQEWNYQKVKTATGAEHEVAMPKAQPGMSYQSAPEGLPPEKAGRLNYVNQAQSRLSEVTDMVFPDGRYNPGIVWQSNAPGAKQLGGVGEGRTLYSKMYQAIDAALRIETGAQAPEPEVRNKVFEYMPSILDSEKVARTKLKDFTEYINGYVNLADPTGEIKRMREPLTPKNTRGTKVNPEGKITKPNYIFNPATGRLEAAQ